MPHIKLKKLLPEGLFDKPSFARTERVHAEMEKVQEKTILRKYKANKQMLHKKPNGLWYAFGNEWTDYVKSVGGGYDSQYNWYYKVNVKGCKMRELKSEKDIIEFTKEYTDFDGSDETLFATFFIDWNLVAKDYDGIEVFPFPKKNMPEAKWLKSWDVSSGCVWNTNKVKLEFVG